MPPRRSRPRISPHSQTVPEAAPLAQAAASAEVAELDSSRARRERAERRAQLAVQRANNVRAMSAVTSMPDSHRSPASTVTAGKPASCQRVRHVLTRWTITQCWVHSHLWVMQHRHTMESNTWPGVTMKPRLQCQVCPCTRYSTSNVPE